MDGFAEPITWSRNFDDEEIEDDDMVTIPEVSFSLNDAGQAALQDGKLKTKLLLIGTRTAASVFLHATYEEKTLLGEVNIKGYGSSAVELRQHSINHKTSRLYVPNGKGLNNDGSHEVLIFISQAAPVEALQRLTKELFSVVVTESIVIFDTLPCSTYLAGVRHQVPSVRRICTSVAREDNAALPAYLEAPVIVDRLAAAVLQYAQLRNMKAVAYISLEDDLYLETATIIAFEPCLKHHTVHPPSNTSYSALLKKVVSHRPNTLFA